MDNPDIFFSYAREDQARVAPMVAALEARGWSVFWDRRIPAGQTWRSHIGRALDQARCVVVAWSEHSINSKWVHEEADEGMERLCARQGASAAFKLPTSQAGRPTTPHPRSTVSLPISV